MYLVRPPYLLKKLFPEAVWRMNALEKKIYLTFDDGPVPEVTPLVLDILKQEHIKATFFCVGGNVVKHPELFAEILKQGHAVGNHTYNHLKGWNTDTGKYLDNINQCAEVVPSALFRPPYGKMKKSQARLLLSKSAPAHLPSTIVMWDVLSGDYDKNTSPEKCLKNVTDNLRKGSIILFHDSIKAQPNMLFALPRFIQFAKQNGYEFCLFEGRGREF
jgi:peptidoglycan-N-acetylglucosamine deacetylase